eukprot:7479564-Pyramimonas_sp.AAC.1
MWGRSKGKPAYRKAAPPPMQNPTMHKRAVSAQSSSASFFTTASTAGTPHLTPNSPILVSDAQDYTAWETKLTMDKRIKVELT